MSRRPSGLTRVVASFRTEPAWSVLAVLAVVIASRNVVDWLRILLSGLPIGYGEGAVVHAGQLLAQGEDPYALRSPDFVSANYPPLGYVLVALGLPLGPFTGLRLANILAACAVAAVIGWRARAKGAVAVALAASFLALFPVGAWVPGNRVDLVAVACTAFAVAALGLRRGGPALFGVLGALALAAKPTAALPLLAVAAYLLWRDAANGLRAILALAAASGVGVLIALARFDARGVYEHLVVHNAFPYDPRLPLFLLVLGALLLGTFVALAMRHGDGLLRAYLVGGFGVLLLGGHEGATINYLLDLSAASCLALAPLATARGAPTGGAPATAGGAPATAGGATARGALAPALLAGPLLATLLLTSVGPFGPPDLDAHAARVAVVTELPERGLYYAEDSALLIAAGFEPLVDDTYVWARLVALGARADDITPRVAAGGLDAIVSDVRLEALDRAAEFQRQRWPAPLVEAVLRRYTLDRAVPGAYRYLPRR